MNVERSTFLNVFMVFSPSSRDATFAKIKHEQNTRENGLNRVNPRVHED
jgi:hypothetical protein